MNGKQWMGVCKILASAIAALLLAGTAYGQQFTIRDLGQTGAWGINDTGEVVGNVGVAGPGTDSRAMVWTAAGGVQKFGIFPGGHYSGGQSINHYGVVVGVADFSNYISHAFLSLGPSKPLRDLGVLYRMTYSQANAINDQNMVVGFSFKPTGTTRAMRWTSATGMVPLNALSGGLNSTAQAINNVGQAVGYSSFGGQQANWHACWWPNPKGVVPTDIGTLPGFPYSYANGINKYGAIVGQASKVGETVAFLWTAAHGMRNLGLLNGKLWTSAQAINDEGAVVGIAYDAKGNPYHAFLWTPAGGMKDLNNLIPAGTGWVLYWASGINVQGKITGFGILHGQYHAFLLTPK